jgi:hypothetical protein
MKISYLLSLFAILLLYQVNGIAQNYVPCSQVRLELKPLEQENCNLAKIPVDIYWIGGSSADIIAACDFTITGQITNSTEAKFALTQPSTLEDENSNMFSVTFTETTFSLSVTGQGSPFEFLQGASFNLFVEAPPGENFGISINETSDAIIDNTAPVDCQSATTCDIPGVSQSYTFQSVSTCSSPNYGLVFDVANEDVCGTPSDNCINIPVKLTGGTGTKPFIGFLLKLNLMMNLVIFSLDIKNPNTALVGVPEVAGNKIVYDVTFLTGAQFSFDGNGEFPLFEVEVSTRPAAPPRAGKGVFTWNHARLQNTSTGLCCQPALTGGTVDLESQTLFYPCTEVQEDFFIADVSDDCNIKYAVSFTANTGNDAAQYDLFYVDLELNLNLTGLTIDEIQTEASGYSCATSNCPQGNDCVTVSGNTITYKYCTTPGSNDIPRGTDLFYIFIEGNSGTLNDISFTKLVTNYSDTDEEGYCISGNQNMTTSKDANSLSGSVNYRCGDETSAAENITVYIGDETCPGCNGDNSFEGVSTDASGNFTGGCNNLPSSDITARACYSNSNCGCGISTFDMVLISKHILNVATLDSPWKILAADVNCSGSVTTLDLVQLRKLVLRVESDFGSCPCYKVIPDSAIPPTTTDPFSLNIPDCATDLSSTSNPAFSIIKVGDVTCDCLTDDFTNPNTDIEIKMPDKTVSATQVFDMVVRSDEFTDLMAFQLGFDFDESKIEFVEVVSSDLSGVTEESNFGTTDVTSGKLRVLWYDANGNGVSLTNKQDLFVLRFEALANISDFSTVISLDETVLENRFWEDDNTVHGADLVFDSSLPRIGNPNQFDIPESATFNSLNGMEVKTVPNPFSNQTTFVIVSPKNEEASIEVFNLNGAKVAERVMVMNEGTNQIILEQLKTLPEGVYNYIVTSSEEKITGQIIKQ